MVEFQPKIVGFTDYHIPEDWIVSKEIQSPDKTLSIFSDYYRVKVKEPTTPIILRMGIDYPLEVFFFENAEITIRVNKNNTKLNECWFDPSTISSIQFPNV